jgi:hypothetical protein
MIVPNIIQLRDFPNEDFDYWLKEVVRHFTLLYGTIPM